MEDVLNGTHAFFLAYYSILRGGARGEIQIEQDKVKSLSPHTQYLAGHLQACILPIKYQKNKTISKMSSKHFIIKKK